MSSQDIQQKYRDEESRKRAWEACQAALEEARIMEEQQGVLVPVVMVDRHPLLAMLLAFCERECASVARQSRARAQLKAYSFDVRAVWLSGDLPLEAPLPWRGLYGAPTSPFPWPPGPHPQRALDSRRDVVAIEAGSHQIQSVSLSRAMAGAFVTQVRCSLCKPCSAMFLLLLATLLLLWFHVHPCFCTTSLDAACVCV
jgi:hypothetical protein